MPIYTYKKTNSAISEVEDCISLNREIYSVLRSETDRYI